jgi:hypothetical protein
METFVYGRELDFRTLNYFEVPLFWTDPFLIVKIDAGVDHRASLGKVWFLPFIPGFGFARSQPTEVSEGVNLLQFSGIADRYKIALQPYSKVGKASLKIWKTDYSDNLSQQLTDIQTLIQLLL